jgi:predicted RecB family nuclease
MENGGRCEQDLTVCEIGGVDITRETVGRTREALEAGTQVVVHGALTHGCWSGRADILRRVETPSAFGAWSYEAIDTKLARETKAGAILQLCLYSDLLGQTQGVDPEQLYVVAPWSDFAPQAFRYLDFAAYYRRAKGGS